MAAFGRDILKEFVKSASNREKNVCIEQSDETNNTLDINKLNSLTEIYKNIAGKLEELYKYISEISDNENINEVANKLRDELNKFNEEALKKNDDLKKFASNNPNFRIDNINDDNVLKYFANVLLRIINNTVLLKVIRSNNEDYKNKFNEFKNVFDKTKRLFVDIIKMLNIKLKSVKVFDKFVNYNSIMRANNILEQLFKLKDEDINENNEKFMKYVNEFDTIMNKFGINFNDILTKENENFENFLREKINVNVTPIDDEHIKELARNLFAVKGKVKTKNINNNIIEKLYKRISEITTTDDQKNYFTNKLPNEVLNIFNDIGLYFMLTTYDYYPHLNEDPKTFINNFHRYLINKLEMFCRNDDDKRKLDQISKMLSDIFNKQDENFKSKIIEIYHNENIKNNMNNVVVSEILSKFDKYKFDLNEKLEGDNYENVLKNIDVIRKNMNGINFENIDRKNTFKRIINNIFNIFKNYRYMFGSLKGTNEIDINNQKLINYKNIVSEIIKDSKKLDEIKIDGDNDEKIINFIKKVIDYLKSDIGG